MSKGIHKSTFGHLPDGTEIEQYTLTNANGLSCKIITYGGAITEINTPDRNGKFANIVLGYDNLEDYLKCTDYRGAIIGRAANRIAGASFELDGKTYKLAANDGVNHLHGGLRGFDKRVWKAQALENPAGCLLMLHYTSEDGEEGYPGDLQVTASYMLTNTNSFGVTFGAHTYKPTPVNMTFHPYWNLRGEGDILGYELTIYSQFHTPIGGDWIPTGQIENVANTPFDFTTANAIGSRMKDYNVNYILKKEWQNVKDLRLSARVYDPETGRGMEMRTNQPGLQFYSATYLSQPYSGFCLEPQNFPDAIHHPHFPDSVLRPGENYFHSTLIRLFAE